MAGMRPTVQFNNYRTWAAKTQKKAVELQESAARAAESLFSSGDLRSFLDLLSRMDHYDATNLLLILQQYPVATCLAGFNYWKSQLEEGASILRPEWRGKGIDLVAPFLVFKGDGDYVLTWGAVKQFDITQTNVHSVPDFKQHFLGNGDHIPLLTKSIKDVIGSEYHKSVFEIAPTPELKAAGLPGQITDMVVSYRSDLKSTQLLNWFLVCLCRSAIPEESPFSTSQLDYAQRCTVHCLYKILGAEDPNVLRPNKALLGSIRPKMQTEYLNLIQRTVRSLEESIYHSYCCLGGIPEGSSNG